MEELFPQINADANGFQGRPTEMPRLKGLFRCLLILLIAVCASHGLDRAHYRELYQKLGVAAKQKNWQAARDVLTEIGRELPAPTPRYFLSLASIEAKLGHKAEAVHWLEKYAATGLNFDLAKDEELKDLLVDPAGQRVAAQMKQRSLPKIGTELVCSLPQSDTMPEDIAYLKLDGQKAEGSFYVSSIQHHTLYRLSLPKAGSKECTMQELPLTEEAKRWPTFAVSADPKQRDEQTLLSLRNATYDSLRAAHEADYQRLYKRVSMDLGISAAAELPTDERIRGFAKGNDQQPTVALDERSHDR